MLQPPSIIHPRPRAWRPRSPGGSRGRLAGSIKRSGTTSHQKVPLAHSASQQLYRRPCVVVPRGWVVAKNARAQQHQQQQSQHRVFVVGLCRSERHGQGGRAKRGHTEVCSITAGGIIYTPRLSRVTRGIPCHIYPRPQRPAGRLEAKGLLIGIREIYWIAPTARLCE